MRLKPTVRPGVALVIVGPQGCGKSTLAQELAAARGAFRRIYADRLDAAFQSWAADGVETVIVDGLPATPDAHERVAAIVASDSMVVNVKGREPFARPTPAFIFCAEETPSLSQDPRFDVFDMWA